MGTNGQGNTGGPFGEALGGMFGGGEGNTAGGISSSIFGGGRAYGGLIVGGKIYEVNERGMPELLNVSSKQLLMMPAGQGERVTPMRTGGGSLMVNNFYLSAPTEHRMQQQIATRVERVQRRAAAWNG